MKRCPKCLGVKAYEDFPPSKRGAYGRDSICRKCHNAADRAWRKARRADPEWVAEHNAKARARAAARMATKEAREAALADRRMRYRMRLDRDAPKLPKNAIGAYDRLGSPQLDAEPFRKWLLEYHASLCARNLYGEWTWQQTARRAELDEAQVRRLLNREATLIGLQVADRAFVGSGNPELLAILYPLDADEGQAA